MADAEKTTLEKIIYVAKTEFLQKGYQGASLRNMVKQAGVTTGAFYGYFQNKKELFAALVGEEYDTLLHIYDCCLNTFESIPPEQQREKMQSVAQDGMKEMIDYLYDHKEAFKLILCCSEGTRFHDLVDELAKMNAAATHNFAQMSRQVGNTLKQVHPILEHILVSGMFAGFFEMIVHDIPRQEADEFSQQLLGFYSAGWQEIMGF